MNESILQKYAALTVRVGANVQKGQTVIVSSSIEQGDFVEHIVSECYKAGAKWVMVNWNHQATEKLHYLNQTLETLSEVPKWKEEKMKMMVEELPCTIHVLSDDPDGLSGIDQEKVQTARMNSYPIIKPYQDAMENKHQWTIVAVPGKRWAKKVFPDMSEADAVQMLWKKILESVHITEDNDPIDAWKAHNAYFKEKCKKLNEYRFDSLHYQSKNGTDFKVWLIPTGRWLGGGETALNGNDFNPNMPTEEVFTAPMAGKAEGTVVATKPLSYQGELIENFSITFKDGKAVDCKASANEPLLKKMISMDEGACKLGEVALVPHDSPISNSGILFYETLFDENASCHLALGRGYSNTLEGFEDMTLEQQTAAGINDSMIHVDFMIGCADLSIKGYTQDGQCIQVFKDGNWAI